MAMALHRRLVAAVRAAAGAGAGGWRGAATWATPAAAAVRRGDPAHLPPLRSLLFVPAKPEIILKGLRSKADAIVCDLEDSVPPAGKAAARADIVAVLSDWQAAVHEGQAADKPVFLRINALCDRREVQEDIDKLVAPGTDGFAFAGVLLPKIRTAQCVHEYDQAVTADERMQRPHPSGVGGVRFIPIIETAAAVGNAASIAGASGRNVGLIFGHADLLVDTNAADIPEALSYARSAVVMGARAAGILPLDGAYLDLRNFNGHETECKRSRALGFAGKAVLHPSQTPTTNLHFGPSSADVKWAQRVVRTAAAGAHQRAAAAAAAATAAQDAPSAIFTVDGAMAGPPVLHRAQRILALASGAASSNTSAATAAQPAAHSVMSMASLGAVGSAAPLPTVSTRSSSSSAAVGAGESTHRHGAQHPPRVSARPVRFQTYGLDLAAMKVGDVITSQLELTMDTALRNTWSASFFEPSPIFTSDEAARTLGMPRAPMPYTMLLVLSVAMSVIRFSENAVVYLGLKNVHQHQPVYPGDTLRNTMKITAYRNTGDGRNSVVTSEHALINQRGDSVLTCTKATLFDAVPGLAPGVRMGHEDAVVDPAPPSFGLPAPMRLPPADAAATSALAGVPTTTPLPWTRLAPHMTLHRGEVLVHRLVKIFGSDEHRGLANLLRVTNQHHHNTLQFAPSQLLIAGPLSVTAVLSCASHDLGPILSHFVHSTHNVNKVNAGDVLGAFSCIVGVKPHAADARLEEVQLVTYGVKNVDMPALAEMPLPEDLFANPRHDRSPREIESLVEAVCPALYHNIVCKVYSTIVRISPALSTSRWSR